VPVHDLGSLLIELQRLQEIEVTGENPYFHYGPIKETRYFYGRARETTRALQMVRNGQSVSVIGPRCIGKTSLLFHLADATVQAEHGLVPQRSLFVYVDASVLGGLSKSAILHTMLRDTVAQTQRDAVKVPQSVDHRSFELVLRELIKPEDHLVYLIDEFEYLSRNPNVDGDFFSFLRSLIARYNIAYITASQSSLLDLIDEDGKLSSPFFNVFMPLYLGLLDEVDARRLIHDPSQAAGTEFSSEVEHFILDFAGLYPFLLQIVCYHAFDLLHDDPLFSERTRGRLEELVHTDLRAHFEYFLSRLSEDEQRVLACLLDSGEIETSTKALESLERKCLVRKCDDGHTFASRAFAEFFGRQVGKAWSLAVAEGERRMATVLFADVVGFTPMTEQHVPEDVLAIIKPALRMFVDAVDRHGGKVANFGGDSVMAVFGVPTSQPDDAVQAVRAALEIQSSVADYARGLRQNKGLDLSARVGLDTGVVVLGEIGGQQRAEYTALGNPVNLAQRLESKAEPGSIVISHHTYQQVRGYFKVRSLGLVRVKGRSNPIRAYLVLRV
jgi:class 3 adenylate cyclase